MAVVLLVLGQLADGTISRLCHWPNEDYQNSGIRPKMEYIIKNKNELGFHRDQEMRSADFYSESFPVFKSF